MAFFDGLSRPVLARYKLPGFVLVGAGMIASVGVAFGVRELTRPARYQLSLDAQHRATSTYFSAFDEGPVLLDHDGSDGRVVTFRRDFTWVDGCDWQAVERLEPEGSGYRYYYVEHFVSLESLRHRATEYLPDRSRTIVAENDSPDVGFRYSLNPYRGCLHGCSYCFARPTHEYLGYNAGLDFESRRSWSRRTPRPSSASSSSRPGWAGRARRDLGGHRLLSAGRARLPADPPASSRWQPRRTSQSRSSPRTRWSSATSTCWPRWPSPVPGPREPERHDARPGPGPVDGAADEHASRQAPRRKRALSEAGVPVRVLVAPVIPGLNDAEIPAILRREPASRARDRPGSRS